MNIAIQSNGLILTESLRADVHRRLETSLGSALTRRLARQRTHDHARAATLAAPDADSDVPPGH